MAVLVTGSVGWTMAQEPPRPAPPEPLREFRGVWIATVANINWPSQPGLSVTRQKAELLAMLDTAADNHLNAVLFQVRPACDALYRSDLEPWSEYLTGTMGKPPAPLYDPLEFVVDAAHRRGLELHAWFNPFRALHPSSRSPVPETHISKTRPDLVHRYGAYLWLDPGDPAARAHSLEVILDVVRRYDIDGVHFDDYFYPYPERDSRGGTLPFADRATWEAHGAGMSRGDWRRRNVDLFVRETQKSVHAEKPWVQFGISPFGIWRPGHPREVPVGLDAYDALYADARRWLREGWVDYMVPQLYWSIDSRGQPFPALLNWWNEQNVRDRHLWIGLNTGKVGGEWPAGEIIEQIRLVRRAGLDGQVHYNIGEFLTNPAFARQLRTELYSDVALTPASPWLGGSPPAPARLEINSADGVRVSWTAAEGTTTRCWVLQARLGGDWTTRVLSGDTRTFDFEGAAPTAVAVRAVNRHGLLSRAAIRTVP